MEKKNNIAILLIVIAILIVVAGAIVGFSQASIGGKIYLSHAWPYWGGALAICSLFLGVAEIVNLLDKIYYRALNMDKNIDRLKDYHKEGK